MCVAFLGVGVLGTGDCCVEFRCFCGVVGALVDAFRLLGEGERDSMIVKLLLMNCFLIVGWEQSRLPRHFFLLLLLPLRFLLLLRQTRSQDELPVVVVSQFLHPPCVVLQQYFLLSNIT